MNYLFMEHIHQIEQLFLEHTPEMTRTLGSMERPEDNGKHLFILDNDLIIPNHYLSLAIEGDWNTKTLSITHYKIIPKEETNERQSEW